MGVAESLLSGVLDNAISELRRDPIALYTFAFYFDHESLAVSVCADTADNSKRVVEKMNRPNNKYFTRAVQSGDLVEAALWQANTGRSLSLGDFSRVNIARRDLNDIDLGADFHLLMVRALLDRTADILKLATDPTTLLFACSTADDEVGLVWSSVENQS
jgi:hypothetical protein